MKKYFLPNFSEEQLNIINNLETYNIIVDSVAGCGKTTTILGIANKYSNKNILVLTYNKRLKEETAYKVKYFSFKNVNVYNYHSFGYVLETTVRDDITLKKALDKGIENSYNYHIIIIDEIQDMNYIYYELVEYIINRNLQKAKICALGDVQQCIYKNNGSDERFILKTDSIFNSDFPWKKLSLSISFRLTKQIASFVNYCNGSKDRIKAIKDGEKPIYIITNTFENNIIIEKIKYFINIKKYNVEDIFIICPSVIANVKDSPIKIIENQLVENNLPVFIPNNDGDVIARNIIKNKIVISSFHRTKGLERKVVFFYNFDTSYYTNYNGGIDTDKLTNPLYVGLTRAMEHLIIIHHHENDFMDYVKLEEIKKYCDVIIDKELSIKNSQKIINMGVDKYLGNLSEETVTESYNIIHKYIKEINPKEKVLTIPYSTEQSFVINIDDKEINNKEINNKEINNKEHDYDKLEIIEQVSDLCGIAIPFYYEYKSKGRITVDENVVINNIEECFILTNHYSSFRSGYLFKINQITDYSWCNQIDIDSFMDRLSQSVSNKSKYEEIVECDYNEYRFQGSIDCVDFLNNIFYEFKIVDELSHKHFIQLSFYKYILFKKLFNDILKILKNNNVTFSHKSSHELYHPEYFDNKYIYFTNGKKRRIKALDALSWHMEFKNLLNLLKIYSQYSFILFNIKDNNKFSLDVPFKVLEQMINYIYENKYKIKKDSDECFTKKCLFLKDKQKQKITIVNKNLNYISKYSNHKVVLDIETNNMKKIIQVSYLILNMNDKIIDTKNIIVNDNSIDIDYYDKITLSSKIKNGIPLSEACYIIYKDLEFSALIIGHNLSKFDLPILEKLFDSYNLKKINYKIFDTMYESKNMVKAKDINGRLKLPSLSETYQFFTKKKINKLKCHDATYDIECTYFCYLEINKILSKREDYFIDV